MRAPAFLAVIAVACLGVAAAHGNPTTIDREFGPYAVTYHTFTLINAEEWLQLQWEVTLAATGEPVTANDATVTFRFTDENNNEVERITKQANLTEPNVYWVNQFVKTVSGLESTLALPEASVVFSEPIAPAVGGLPPPPTPSPTNDTPGFGAALLLLSGLVAVAVLRRR